MHYYSHIDGIRGVAVALVVLFHAGLGFSGGYVGVDVFFVISGYLITSSILRAVGDGGFSFMGFWGRRVRRLMPASLVMVSAVAIAGYFLLEPGRLARLGRAIVAQGLFVSNVATWRWSGDYFADGAHEDPLLHCWSLSLEEQFYFLLPFALLVVVGRSEEVVRRWLVLLGLASLAMCIYLTFRRPSAAYYMPFSRAWELLCGGYLATSPRLMRLVGGQHLGALGFLAILGSAVWFDSSVAFPGALALIPVAGAVLLLACVLRGGDGVVFGVLGLPAMRFLGLISYSLYLIHWPALFFVRHQYGDALVGRLVAVVVSILLAYCSWRFVEQPTRHGPQWKDWRRMGPAVLVGFAFTTGAGIVFWQSDGLMGRLSEEARLAWDRHSIALGGGPHPPEHKGTAASKVLASPLGTLSGVDDDLDFVLWGDSHALAVGSEFGREASRLGLHGQLIWTSGIVPLPGLAQPRRGATYDPAGGHQEAVLKYLGSVRPRRLVLVARWCLYLEGTLPAEKRPKGQFLLGAGDRGETLSSGQRAKLLSEGFRRILRFCEDEGILLVIMRQPPEIEYVPGVGVKDEIFRTGSIPILRHREGISGVASRQLASNDAIDRVMGQGALVLDPRPLFVDARGNVRIQDDQRRVLFSDTNHVSAEGARLISPLIRDALTLGR